MYGTKSYEVFGQRYEQNTENIRDSEKWEHMTQHFLVPKNEKSCDHMLSLPPASLRRGFPLMCLKYLPHPRFSSHMNSSARFAGSLARSSTHHQRYRNYSKYIQITCFDGFDAFCTPNNFSKFSKKFDFLTQYHDSPHKLPTLADPSI